MTDQMTDQQTIERPPEQDVTPTRLPAHPGRIVAGIVLLLLGVAWVLEVAGVSLPWQTMLAVGLVVVGGTLIYGARTGTHGGLIALGVALTVVLTVGSVAAPYSDVGLIGSGAGDRLYTPTRAGQVVDGYQLSIGTLTVDVRGVDFAEGTRTTLPASVGIGQLVVIVPANVTVDLTGDVGIGEIVAFGTDRGGVIVSVDDVYPGLTTGGGTLVVEASVGLGRLEVRR